MDMLTVNSHCKETTWVIIFIFGCTIPLTPLLNACVCRVYDNALANAVMQQAAIILQIEESMSCLRRFYDNEHIHRHCAPLGEFFDDDVTTNPDQHAEMKKLTEQIKVSTLTTTGSYILNVFSYIA